MYCPTCGAPQIVGVTVCTQCGSFMPSPQYPPQQPYGMQQIPQQYIQPMSGPANIRSIVGMILGLASFAGFGLLFSIPGLIVSKLEMNAIKRGEAPKAGEAYAKVGFYSSLGNIILIGVVILIFISICGPILWGFR